LELASGKHQQGGTIEESMSSLPDTSIGPGTRRAARVGAALARLTGRHGNAAGALGVRLAAAGLAYLLQIILARSLGASAYGIFSFSWNLVTIGGFLATLGFGQIAVRFLAQYHQAKEYGLARGFMRAGILASLGGSIAFAALAIAIFPLVERGYGHLCIMVLAIGVIALPFFALTDFMEGVARSQGWTIRALLPPYVIRQGLLILILLAAVIAGRSINAEAAMAAALAATVLAGLAQAILIARPLRAALPRVAPAYDFAEWRRAARPTFLSDLAMLARQNIDLILIGLLAPAAVIGLYFAATRIASLLGLIDFAVGAAFGHRFARAKESETKEASASETTGKARASTTARIEPLFAEARRLTFLPGVLAAVMLALGAPLILALFGADFVAATDATRILLAAGALRLAAGPVEDALAMAGHPDAVWRANAIGALVMAILCLLLTRDYHATGAALAAAGGTLASLAVLILALRRNLGFWAFAARPGMPAS
jgi:O-antigen/teichoic acid export membrane protein